MASGLRCAGSRECGRGGLSVRQRAHSRGHAAARRSGRRYGQAGPACRVRHVGAGPMSRHSIKRVLRRGGPLDSPARLIAQPGRSTMAISVARVNQVLAGIIDPNTGKDLVSTRSARNVRVEGNDVSLDVELGYPAASQIEPIRRAVIDALKGAGAGNVSANVTMKIVAHTVQRGLKVMPNVKNIIAVASGKGGVGKSTVAANLALALSAEGARVGVLDADVYGPSQPTMLGISGKPESIDGRTLEPMENYGLQMSSIGLLIDADQPMVWRGPMVTQALQQLLTQTNWKDIDYLVVDMPPGTGDIQLTLAQQVPVTGAVIVTTPQDIALMDAK